MRLTGYADRLSVAPGEVADFMVSCEDPSFTVRIVRLLHGDRNPDGPGFKQEGIESPVDGEYPGRRQTARIGSCATVAGLPELTSGFGFSAWVYPTTTEWPAPQCICARRSPAGGGFGVYVEGGRLSLRLGGGGERDLVLSADEALRPNRWYFVYAGLDGAGSATLEWQTSAWLSSSGRVEAPAGDGPELGGEEPFLLAAEALGEDGVAGSYNGKIAAPQLFCRGLDPEERTALAADRGAGNVARDALVAAWNLSSDPSSNRFRDISGHGHDGELFNRPMSVVTDHRWDGSSADWKVRPEHFEAVHFHSDDLADAGWEPDFSWQVPADLPSGLYAARLRSGEYEDHIPITVRPPRTHATAEVGVLMPTFTYLAYANERMRENVEGFEDNGMFAEIAHDPREPELGEHPEYGNSLYDLHPDGSGVCYSSAKRPILNMRPDYMMWAVRAGRHLGADLYLIDWLREKGFEHDTFTDHDLHFDGAALLERYRVLITGGHPEYWSAQMLEALQTYLDGGGRLMYLGGNGFYWVTSIDPANPHVVEVRRGFNGTRVWESAPGEGYHSTTGEQGGLWRYRGKDPNRLVGIGFASQGFSQVSPGYARRPDATGAIAEIVFEGVDEDPFGTYGLVMGGAAGDEIDRADPAHGTPEHTIVLASSTGHDDYYQVVIEDLRMITPGLGGTEHPGVRSDITFTETPNDGAVFAAGSISWSGSLSHNGYDNGVSRVTENVLRAFLTVGSWPRQEA